jgi:hypothetical protein
MLPCWWPEEPILRTTALCCGTCQISARQSRTHSLKNRGQRRETTISFSDMFSIFKPSSPLNVSYVGENTMLRFPHPKRRKQIPQKINSTECESNIELVLMVHTWWRELKLHGDGTSGKEFTHIHHRV